MQPRRKHVFKNFHIIERNLLVPPIWAGANSESTKKLLFTSKRDWITQKGTYIPPWTY